MQFLVLGYDGHDSGALDRRMAARDKHLAMGAQLKAEGKWLYAAAILDDNDKMIGSAIVCDFDSREALDRWLADEPYVNGKVWEKVEVQKCKVAPWFIQAQVTV